jgi:Galactose-1-phosphate uridylyltransferase
MVDMNEMRRDPVTGKWVIVDRSMETKDVVAQLRAAVERDTARIHPPPCDFCPGQEKNTPGSIAEFVDGQYHYQKHFENWEVRVIPNRRPVFRIEGTLNRRPVAMYDVMDAIGAHEMIVETRGHSDWDELQEQEIADILRVYQERMNDLSKDERFGHLFIFKNFGPSASGQLQHPHSTLIASPSVPERIRRELDFTRRHYLLKERCLFCDILNEELRRKNHHSGLVRTYDGFLTFSPFFASHPFETWVLPRAHNSDYRTISSANIMELAHALQENLHLIKQIFGRLSYTLFLFTRPNKLWGAERDYWSTIDSDYHWHFKFFPRFPRETGFHRGFSAGSGYMINQIAPEIAAEMLRSAGNKTKK